MAVREILLLGNKLLLEQSTLVEDACALHIQNIIADLSDTLAEFRSTHGFGRAIAAPQIGRLKRIIFVRTQGFCGALINPVIEWADAQMIELWDDCFSFPDLMVRLRRSAQVRVRYIDEHGREQVVDASGDLSELLQHEIDHLDGVLALHRATGRDAFAYRSELLKRK